MLNHFHVLLYPTHSGTTLNRIVGDGKQFMAYDIEWWHESINVLFRVTLTGRYDYTISKLGPSSGGAHEISLVYIWPMRNPRKPPKDKMIIPCPSF